MEQRVQAAREKEWEKLVSLEREKIDLETTVAELQQLVTQMHSHRHTHTHTHTHAHTQAVVSAEGGV